MIRRVADYLDKSLTTDEVYFDDHLKNVWIAATERKILNQNCISTFYQIAILSEHLSFKNMRNNAAVNKEVSVWEILTTQSMVIDFTLSKCKSANMCKLNALDQS